MARFPKFQIRFRIVYNLCNVRSEQGCKKLVLKKKMYNKIKEQ